MKKNNKCFDLNKIKSLGAYKFKVDEKTNLPHSINPLSKQMAMSIFAKYYVESSNKIKTLEYKLSDKPQISEEDFKQLLSDLEKVDKFLLPIGRKNDTRKDILEKYLKLQPPKEPCRLCKNTHKKFPLKYHDNTEGAGYTYQLKDCVCCPECGKKLSEVKDD